MSLMKFVICCVMSSINWSSFWTSMHLIRKQKHVIEFGATVWRFSKQGFSLMNKIKSSIQLNALPNSIKIATGQEPIFSFFPWCVFLSHSLSDSKKQFWYVNFYFITFLHFSSFHCLQCAGTQIRQLYNSIVVIRQFYQLIEAFHQ